MKAKKTTKKEERYPDMDLARRSLTARAKEIFCGKTIKQLSGLTKRERIEFFKNPGAVEKKSKIDWFMARVMNPRNESEFNKTIKPIGHITGRKKWKIFVQNVGKIDH